MAKTTEKESIIKENKNFLLSIFKPIQMPRKATIADERNTILKKVRRMLKMIPANATSAVSTVLKSELEELVAFIEGQAKRVNKRAGGLGRKKK